MKYRKKPVVIEAYQWMPDSWANQADWPQWLQDASRKKPNEKGSLFLDSGGTLIYTLEGHHVVLDNDFIIQGVAGEMYPCKPDIFEATYEKV